MEKRKRCAVKSRCLSAGVVPYGNWFAPPGSNRSSGLGNEAVGAFGVKDRISDSASMQVVMRMNVEEASKTSMQVLTGPLPGKADNDGRDERTVFIVPAGVVTTTCMHRKAYGTREVPAVIARRINGNLVRDRSGRLGWRRGAVL